MKTEQTKTVDPPSNAKNRFRYFAACLFSTKFRAGGVKLENLAAAAAAASNRIAIIICRTEKEGGQFLFINAKSQQPNLEQKS